jgi:FkbM family methyltransferase
VTPSASPRAAIERAFHVVRRSYKGLGDAEYRRAIAARALMGYLHRLNPDVRYLGLVEGEELTFLHVADSVITPWVVAVGHFQRNVFQMAWRECQRHAPPESGGVFVDVGANVGTTTLYAMRTGDFSHAVCLEPSPDNLKVLRLNVLANGLGDEVTVIAAACSSQEGTADLWVSSVSQGDHRLAHKGAAPDTHQSSLGIKTVSLDGALQSSDVKVSDVSMVWVDTQGHEPEVLSGASNAIDAGVPFCIEFWPTQYSDAGTLDHMIELVEDRFTNFLDLGATNLGVRPIAEVLPLADRLLQGSRQTDILLFPRASN